MTTANIMNEFHKKIDITRDYDLKEMTQVLSDVYKSIKPTKKGKTTQKKCCPSDDDSDKHEEEPVQKRVPTAYNKFMSERMKAIKQENPDTNAKEIMKMASVEWKGLSDEQKASYK